MIGSAADSNSDGKLSESELTALTVAQLKELATEKCVSLTQSTKANIIAEILAALYPTTLSAMALGELELTPEFDAGTTAYTASTVNAKDKLSFTKTDAGAKVTVKLGDSAVTAGEDGKYEFTWASGSNTVTVKVENGYNDELYTTYTITVTAE